MIWLRTGGPFVVGRSRRLSHASSACSLVRESIDSPQRRSDKVTGPSRFMSWPAEEHFQVHALYGSNPYGFGCDAIGAGCVSSVKLTVCDTSQDQQPWAATILIVTALII
jgi:hypothetical protein